MVFRIAIDAGHGNNTAGKRTPDGSLREFHFNNPVAQMVGKFLMERYTGILIMYPYDTTGAKDTPLNDRTKAANRWGADALVSIHANAYGSGWNSAGGIETFIYPTASKSSKILAANVQNQLLRWTGLQNRGVKTGNFAVIRDTKCPAVLVECGFMSNKEEAALLKSPAYRAKCAEAITAGIAITFGLQKKAGAPSNAATAKTTMDKEVEKMADLFITGSAAQDAATLNVLKTWENDKENAISSIWRQRLEKGELTTAQALGLIYVALDRGIVKL